MTFFNDYFQFFYDGKRLIYENGNWVLTNSQHPAIPCKEFEARKILRSLKDGDIRGFGYSPESLERALEMFNRSL